MKTNNSNHIAHIIIDPHNKNSLNYKTEPDARWNVFYNNGGENVITIKNRALRTIEAENYFIWTRPEGVFDMDSAVNGLLSLDAQYETAAEVTGIPYFTGTLKSEVSVDYGNSVIINAGTGLSQVVDIEFITAKAIKHTGYFDVRMTDFCSIIDYANRLSQKGLLPRCEFKRTPWLFDIKNDREINPKIAIDNMSSQWYSYKHENLPWEQIIGSEEDLKTELKKIALWQKKKSA